MKKIKKLNLWQETKKGRIATHGSYKRKDYCIVKTTDLDALEAENQEMLEALIAYRNDISEEAEEETGIYIDDIIEKVSGKTWEQIKESEG